jgi:hypothetical protein
VPVLFQLGEAGHLAALLHHQNSAAGHAGAPLGERDRGGDAGRGRRELGGRRLLVVGGALRRHLVSNNPCTKAAHVLNLRELTGSLERAAEAVTKVGG